MKIPSMGQQEMELLHFIVERGGASVRDAVEGYGAQKGLARTTVLTMMERLRKKGYLKREGSDRKGGANLYTPSSPPTDLMTKAVGAFVEKALGGSVSPVVAYLAERVDVADDDIDELKKLLSRLEIKRKGEDM